EEHALGARGGYVEEVALPLQLALADRQQQAAGLRDRPAVLIGQERLRAAPARELALLEAADEHRLEAAGADVLGPRLEHPVGLSPLAEPHPQSGERVVQARGIEAGREAARAPRRRPRTRGRPRARRRRAGAPGACREPRRAARAGSAARARAAP